MGWLAESGAITKRRMKSSLSLSHHLSKFSYPLNFFPLQNFTLSIQEQERDFIFSTGMEGKTSALETNIGC